MKTRARIAITIRNTRHLVECKKIGEILWELAGILACSRRCLWPIDPRSIRTIGVFPPFSKTGEHSSRSTYRDRSLLHLLILRVMQAPISFFPKGRNGHCCNALMNFDTFHERQFKVTARTMNIRVFHLVSPLVYFYPMKNCIRSPVTATLTEELKS